MLRSPHRSFMQAAARGILVAAIAIPAPAAIAQEALEEITVTARKVAESLQEAPLSVVVLTGDVMADSGISRVEELVSYVPNFAMSETGIGTNLYVRGIGSGINQGFEQSVGLYIDGIYYGRAQLTRAPFMDMAQAEALRGPQAILLGNNSIAGALNFTTARPTESLEAEVSVLYEPDHNEQEINGMISGPLGELFGLDWGARFAGRYRTMDGYVDNTLLSRDEPDREETSARLTFAFQGETVDGSLKLETNSFDVKGRQIEIIRADPATTRGSSQTGFSNNTGSSALWGEGYNYLEFLDQFFDGDPPVIPPDFDPAEDYVLDNDGLRDGTLDYDRQSNGDQSKNDINAIVGTVNFALGEHTLTSTLGYLEYDYTEDCDCDFTGSNMFQLTSEEDYSQYSIELRLTSPQDGPLRYLGGIYYQADELDFGDQIFLPEDSGVVRLVGYATTGNPEGAFGSLGNTSAFRDFEQNTYNSSIFGQVGYDLTERWRASIGVRYSHIEKEASRILREGDLERNPFNLNDENDLERLAVGSVLFASIFDVAFHQLSGSRTEDNTAFEFVTDFDLNDDVLLYGSVKTGFKGGGFDVRSNSEPVPGSTGVGTLFPEESLAAVQNNVSPGSFEFEDEQATAFEAGSKISLLNGTAEINVAVFYTTFDDLQVSIFDGTLGFNVGNAAKAITQGVEIDGRWAITDDWSLNGSLGYLDFEFDDFKNGQCNQGQAPDSPGGFCDYTGQTNQYVADWSGNLAVNYEHPLTENLLFRGTADTQFTTEYNPSQNLDPRVEQEMYAIVNLRLALAGSDDRWEVALLGRNLFDEKVVSYANDTPLAFSQFGAPTWYGFLERSRNVALQASYRFGE
ncbi:MAG: TonB-dependent receptor [Deltaproteobacteria bacterium]|nr:TonB-dependent receptor [Deltaproteobacteria bacterium]